MDTDCEIDCITMVDGNEPTRASLPDMSFLVSPMMMASFSTTMNSNLSHEFWRLIVNLGVDSIFGSDVASFGYSTMPDGVDSTHTNVSNGSELGVVVPLMERLV
jgi:hypothetical protein